DSFEENDIYQDSFEENDIYQDPFEENDIYQDPFEDNHIHSHDFSDEELDPRYFLAEEDYYSEESSNSEYSRPVNENSPDFTNKIPNMEIIEISDSEQDITTHEKGKQQAYSIEPQENKVVQLKEGLMVIDVRMIDVSKQEAVHGKKLVQPENVMMANDLAVIHRVIMPIVA
ncbi:3717_t:CDS:2, partial [Racocetra fulgida]